MTWLSFGLGYLAGALSLWAAAAIGRRLSNQAIAEGRRHVGRGGRAHMGTRASCPSCRTVRPTVTARQG